MLVLSSIASVVIFANRIVIQQVPEMTEEKVIYEFTGCMS